MIQGVVSETGKPLLPIAIRGVGGAVILIEAVIDTGFDGVLVVNQTTGDLLGAASGVLNPIRLADSSAQWAPVVALEILWHGQWIEADTFVIGYDSLAGMSLLHGSDLHVEAIEGGAVTVVERPAAA